MDRGAWQDTVHVVAKESDVTKGLNYSNYIYVYIHIYIFMCIYIHTILTITIYIHIRMLGCKLIPSS